MPRLAAQQSKEQAMSAMTMDLHGVPARRVARSQGRHLHLTSRGRRVVTGLAVALALVVGLIGGRAMASSPEEGVAVDVDTVGAGETLWGIAAAGSAPGTDVRDAVEALMSLNELSSSSLAPGQQLLVPVAGD